jgi:hypothetical protein
MICARCKYDYPDDVSLSPVIGSDEPAPVCGICALEMVNAIHGTTMKKFRGEMAESFRQQALAARSLERRR